MKCNKCGQELENGVQFCPECGAAVPKQEEAKNAILIGGVVAAIVALIIWGSSVFGRTIDLNKYVSVNFSGYDTVGKASIDVDYKALEADYGDKIRMKDTTSKEKMMMAWGASNAEILKDSIRGIFELDQTTDLSNGDKVTLSCDESTLKQIKNKFNYKLKFKEQKYKVKDLEEITSVDIFELVNVFFTGIAPEGSVTVEYPTEKYSISFDVTPSEGLSNGDTVVVSVPDTYVNQLAEYKGIKLLETEKEYVVEGLAKRVTDYSEITDEALEKIKTKTETILQETARDSWDSDVSLEEVTYIGNYFLEPKSATVGGVLNVVYEITASVNLEKHDINDKFSYYYTCAFSDFIVLPDGTISLNAENYGEPRDHVNKNYNVGIGSWKKFYFRGYENLDSLFYATVTEKLSKYNYVDNISQ